MELLAIFAPIALVQIAFCNFNYILALQNNIINQNNNKDTHTFNLLSPIKQHQLDVNDVQLKGLDILDDTYHKITKKLIGIEKLGEEIAETDYLPQEITEIKPPNPTDEQKESLSDFDEALKDTSERLVSTNQSELESSDKELKARDKLLDSTKEIFEENNSKENKEENHIPRLEDELQMIENERIKPDFVCMPDYSLPCPIDYVLYDKYCIAKKSYKGVCNHRVKAMAEEDSEFKEAWSKECQTRWPCMPEKCPNGTDYTKQCPITYTIDGLYCRSPIQNDMKYISFKNINQKIEFERANGVRWPCKTGYISNYAKECPKGYVKADNKCKSVLDAHSQECDAFDVPMTVDAKLQVQYKCKLTGW